MDTNQIPQLSIVILTQAFTNDLLALITQLGQQQCANSLELIIVTFTPGLRSQIPSNCSRFFSTQLLEIEHLSSIGQAKATGVKVAQAPLVAFSENHCRINADWAQSLIDIHHRHILAAAGPTVYNANPYSNVSWASFLVFYGPWMAHQTGRRVNHLPGNQSCYRRDIIMNYNHELSNVLESESLLHWDLVRKGHQLRLEPKAATGHINITRLNWLLEEHYLASRIFASFRIRHQSTLKRLIYIIGSPLIPLIRFVRILKEIKKARLNTIIFRKALIPIIINLVAGTLGEMAGYALGIGDARKQLVRFEIARDNKQAANPIAPNLPFNNHE